MKLKKLNEKRTIVLAVVVSITLTFYFLANIGSNRINLGNFEGSKAEHEDYDLLLNVATSMDLIESVFDAKSNDYAQKGYYPQIYRPSLQATYYALSTLESIGNLSEIDQGKVITYIMSHYNSSTHQFVDSSAKRYLSSEIPGLYLPLTTLLEVNCYAALSLDVLNSLHLIDTAETIDFIWECYHPTLHGFIGQPYDASLEDGFKIPTADNTYYAVIALDLLMSDWSSYSQERNDIINFIDGLQSLGSYTGFFNDNNHLFDSLLEIEPNQFASFYAIKTLETFGSGYISVINVAKFHQDLTDLYHSEGSYFDIASIAWLDNYTNIVATAINLELSDITGFTGFDRAGVINFITENRNDLGGWDASTTIKSHELIDTFQIIRSLANTGAISELDLSAKNEIACFIKLFSISDGYSLLPEDYTSVELIHAIISSYDYFDRIGELDIQGLYDLLKGSALYMGGGYEFFACTNLDPNIPSFRSKPLDYYTLGYHKHVDEINVMYSHKETYSILNSLQKIFKLNDLAAFCDLNSVLQEVIDSQFLDPDYQENYGAFSHDIMFSSSEWKNKLIYLKYTFYAIKVMELITDYLGLGPITDLAFNKTALANYVVGHVVETPSELYFDLKYSDRVEDRLENLYYAIYALKATDQFDLDPAKIENFVLSHLNYSNVKNLYYSYKISQILGLEIAFDVEQSHALIQSIYSDTYYEFFESTDRKRIEQEALLWICEMTENEQKPPDNFVISSNAGSPDDDGNFTLMWTSSDEADNYSVYRYSKYITEINGSLTLLLERDVILSLPLNGYSNGTFYFVAVAFNDFGDKISNCINVTVAIPPDPPNPPDPPDPPGNFAISSNASNPDEDGNFTLTWTISNGANNYSIYAYTSYITEINESLILVVKEVGTFSTPIRVVANGTFYFVAVAFNDFGNTTSNCINVTVALSQNPDPPDPPNPPNPSSLPGIFVISSNANDPEEDGNFTLEWTSSEGADNYSVYQYSRYITEINDNLTLLLEEVANLSLTLSGCSNGTYYFVVVAFNDFGNTTSNCINLTIDIMPPYTNDPPNNDPNRNYLIETSTIALLAIGSIGVPAGTIVALKKVRFAKKAKRSALNN